MDDTDEIGMELSTEAFVLGLLRSVIMFSASQRIPLGPSDRAAAAAWKLFSEEYSDQFTRADFAIRIRNTLKESYVWRHYLKLLEKDGFIFIKPMKHGDMIVPLRALLRYKLQGSNAMWHALARAFGEVIDEHATN